MSTWRSEAPADPSMLRPPSAQQLQPPKIGLDPRHVLLNQTPTQILAPSQLRANVILLNYFAGNSSPQPVFIAPSQPQLVSEAARSNPQLYLAQPPNSVAVIAPGMWLRTLSREELWAFCPLSGTTADIWIYEEVLRA